MNKYLELYLSFLKIGSFTLGGGYVMVPLIQNMAVDNKKWCTEKEMIDFISIAQSVPGMFGGNVATNVGYKVGGFFGSICALAGIVTPSIIIITLFASIYEVLMSNIFIANAFRGIQSAVVALIIMAIIRIYKGGIKNNFQKILIIFFILLSVLFNVNPFYLVVIGMFLGAIYNIILIRK